MSNSINRTVRIPLARPTFGKAEERAVVKVLRSGWISHGPRAIEFEKRLADYLGSKHVRVVNSGTSAILLALKALGVGPGASVVVPAFTCAATALPVLALGADVAFADVDLATYNLAWPKVEKVLRPNTKAVVLVHLFGRMADARGMGSQCAERGIHLVEDACLALGARRAGGSAGTLGTAGCFSFHPRKVITTGEGGAVCTSDDALAASIESDRNYGAACSAWARFAKQEGRLRGFGRLAFNFKLTDLQAAIGLVQMRRLPQLLRKRRRIAAYYRELLADIPGLVLPSEPGEEEADANQAFVCLWAPMLPQELLNDNRAFNAAVASRELIRRELTSRGIAFSDAAQFLPGLPVFLASSHDRAATLCETCPSSYLAAALSFALPIFPGMKADAVEQVAKAVGRAARKARATMQP
jgi:perosamine synthetase